MGVRGFGSRWLYPPDKVIRIPAWLEHDVRAFCMAQEVERFRAEVRECHGLVMAHAEATRDKPKTNAARKYAAKNSKRKKRR